MIPGLEISPGEGNGNPLQYSCLGKPIDRGAWQATAHWVAKSLAQLSDQTTTKGCSYPWLMSSLHLQSQQWPVKSFSCYSALTLTLLPSSSIYHSGLPFPSPRNLSEPGIKLVSLALQTDSLLSEPPGKLGKYDTDHNIWL